MKKPFLLIAWDTYYPESSTRNWIGCYETLELALSQVIREPVPLEVFQSGPRKGQVKPNQTQKYKFGLKVGDRSFDYYDVVDLRDWAE